MSVTLTAEEYYDLRKRAITPEQWKAKRDRIVQAAKDFVGNDARYASVSHDVTQRLVGVVVSILEPEGDIYDPQNNPNQRKETCPHS